MMTESGVKPEIEAFDTGQSGGNAKQSGRAGRAGTAPALGAACALGVKWAGAG